jgi:hypothetical protein
MKPREAAALEIQLLLQLVASIKGLKVSGEPEPGTIITLKCPCGKAILPPIAILPSIWDRQRGLLKSKIERHLRDNHGVARQTIARVLQESFAEA